MISISKAEYIELKHDVHCWWMRFDRLNEHRNRDVKRLKNEMARRAECAVQALSKLQDELERVRAQVKDFQKRLFGQKSEKSNGMPGRLPSQNAQTKRPRGQQRGQPGHGRTMPTTLPVEIIVIWQLIVAITGAELTISSPGWEIAARWWWGRRSRFENWVRRGEGNITQVGNIPRIETQKRLSRRSGKA